MSVRPSATVLIVDDETAIGELMKRVLRYLGHSAVHVPSGADALKYVRDSIPDAVVLDYMMPGMDGLEVLRALRDDPTTANLPVIMFSAHSDPMVVASAMQAGANDYWVKASLDVEEMETRLSRCLTPPRN